MIQKLRRKLVLSSMLSLTLVLLVIMGTINLINYRRMVREADSILAVLIRNDGHFPKKEKKHGENHNNGETNGEPDAAGIGTEAARNESGSDRNGPGAAGGEQKSGHGDGNQKEPWINAETPFESRFFTVRTNPEGEVTAVDIERIAAVDEDSACGYAVSVLASGKTAGFSGSYRYAVAETEGGRLAVFLDRSRSLSAFFTTLVTGTLISAGGLLAVFLLLLVFSWHIIRPIAESYEKQKRFITDAGHEIKTPLTIISADADLIELETGENEWLTDIRQQAERLTGLTNDLIYLSRMDEERPSMQCIDFLLSDVAEELGRSFAGLARAKGLEMRLEIEPMLECHGDEKAIRQLLSVLLDNAVKYASDEAPIVLSLSGEGHGKRISVSNATDAAVDKESLNRLFDRFYRGDQSRNSAVGGYGLGLSIARSVVAAHKGKIRASSTAPNNLTITVTLPEG